MRKLFNRLQPRELVLCEITVLLLIAVPLSQRHIVPAYDRWRLVRTQLASQALEYAKLADNIAVKDSVDEAFARLGPDAIQTNSDQITLSLFLSNVENTLSRRSNLTMVNATPLPVKEEAGVKIYRVALTVAGTLQENLEFVSDMVDNGAAVGVESFSLRGVQGNRMVECSIQLRKLHLLSNDAAKSSVGNGRAERKRQESPDGI